MAKVRPTLFTSVPHLTGGFVRHKNPPAGWGTVAAVAVFIAVLNLFPISSRSGETTNQYCPVTTTELVDENIFVDYQGQRIYFCCKGCRKDFLADPERYLVNLSKSQKDTSHDAVSTSSAVHESHEHTHQHSDDDRAEQPSSNQAESTTHVDDHSHNVGKESEDEAAHDHAKDHGEEGSVITFLGKFHPVVIHFPIALVITGFVFAWLGVLYKQDFFDATSINVMYLAAVSAVVTALLGLAAGSGATYPSLLSGYFSWHRILGISSAGLTLVSAYLGFRYDRKPSPSSGWLYRLALLVNALLVGLTGHFGATLIYGPDHFSF